MPLQCCHINCRPILPAFLYDILALIQSLKGHEFFVRMWKLCCPAHFCRDGRNHFPPPTFKFVSFVVKLFFMYVSVSVPLSVCDCRSRSHVTMTVSQSVSMSRYRAHSGTCDQILLSPQSLFCESCCLVSVGRPLWREVRSVICHSQSVVIYQHLHRALDDKAGLILELKLQ
jgi:hypothetical protein